MKITPLEIEQRQFEKSFRGYDIDEVGRYLANISQEWERMISESKMLKMQLEVAEKEASKLREVETTLIKTLRTAEDTSSRIAEKAQSEADKTLADAKSRAEQLISDAEQSAKATLDEADRKAAQIRLAAKNEFSEMESKFSNVEAEKLRILNQLKAIVDGTNKVITDASAELSVIHPSQEVSNSQIESNLESDTPTQSVEIEAEPLAEIETDEELGMSFGSAANELNIEPDNNSNKLEIIEGIGPKIKEVLNSEGILTFRDLASTPISSIKAILEAAGPHFSAHDPSSWVEQALLADAGKWDELDRLKEYLVTGRAPKAKVATEKSAPASDNGSNTEEMLDKVNKVKAAIRKSMMEKEETAKPYAGQGTGSFFDSIN